MICENLPPLKIQCLNEFKCLVNINYVIISDKMEYNVGNLANFLREGEELNGFYMIQVESPLRPFMRRKTKKLKKLYILAEILSRVNEEIDLNNSIPSRGIIFCSSSFATILGVQMMHISELVSAVMGHLSKVADVNLVKLLYPGFRLALTRVDNINAPKKCHYSQSANSEIEVGSFFVCSSNLRAFLYRKGYIDEDRMILSFYEAKYFLLSYLLQNRPLFLPPYSNSVLIIRGDPIQTALGVELLHPLELDGLLKDQLFLWSPQDDQREIHNPLLSIFNYVSSLLPTISE